MRLRMFVRLAALVTLFGLVALATPAQDQSSDVAAAARKAREQQKNAPKPKKVLTNDDIPSVNTSAAPAEATQGKSEGPQGTAKAQDQKNDKKEEEDPNSEGAWRKRFGAVRAKLAQSERELDVLQRELDTGQVQYYSDPQKAMMQQHDRTDINEKTAKVDAKKKEIEGLKQQISDMEDQLRKAGGDPGWAR